MNEQNQENIIAVLKALDEDWAIVDEKDEDDFVIFVNESRDEMENFQPKKDFIKEIEKLGFIEDAENELKKRERQESIHYRKDSPDGEWIPVKTHDPIVHYYKVTGKGRMWLNSRT